MFDNRILIKNRRVKLELPEGQKTKNELIPSFLYELLR